MPRLRPAPEPKKEDPKVLLKDKIENSSMSGLGEEVEVEEPEVETEIEVEEPETPQQDDATITLQKQLDDLRKSEQIQKDLAAQAMRERDEALRRSRERDEQLTRVQKEAQESQFDAISSALAAAKAEADKAQLDIENAISLGDAKGQADAYRRLAVASANLARLEEGKEAIEARNKETPTQPAVSNDPLVDSPLPSHIKDYLRKHPELLTDPRKNAKLQSLHWDALDAGHAQYSPSYVEFVDERLYPKQQEQQPAPQQQQRGTIVSAPPSREVPSGSGTKPSGKIKLTPEQIEAARMAGIPLEEYAKQLIKLNELKANGQYTGGQ